MVVEHYFEYVFSTYQSIFHLFIFALGLCCYSRLSLVAKSRVYSLGTVRGLLIAVTSLVTEHVL